MKKLLKRFTAVITAMLCIAMMAPLSVDADDEAFNRAAVVMQISEEVKDKVDPFITLVSTTYVLDIERDKMALTADELIQVNTQLEVANSKVKAILNQASSDREFVSIDTKKITVSPEPISNATSRYREGVTKVEWYWWGARVFVSRSMVNRSGAVMSIAGILIPEAISKAILSVLGVVMGKVPGGYKFDSNAWILGGSMLILHNSVLAMHGISNIRWQ